MKLTYTIVATLSILLACNKATIDGGFDCISFLAGPIPVEFEDIDINIPPNDFIEQNKFLIIHSLEEFIDTFGFEPETEINFSEKDLLVSIVFANRDYVLEKSEIQLNKEGDTIEFLQCIYFDKNDAGYDYHVEFNINTFLLVDKLDLSTKVIYNLNSN